MSLITFINSSYEMPETRQLYRTSESSYIHTQVKERVVPHSNRQRCMMVAVLSSVCVGVCACI